MSFFDDHEIIVSTSDTTGRITYANDVFMRVAGYGEAELLSALHSIVRRPDMPRCVFKLLWDTIAAQVSGIQGASRATVTGVTAVRNTIDRVKEIVGAIAAALEQQHAATREIAQSVQQASEPTSKVTSNIKGVTKAAGETGVAAGTVADAAGAMTDQSRSVSQEMGRFIQQIRSA